jgi:D-glycero-alpha-D-manno-heptose-7-phosphate kinase
VIIVQTPLRISLFGGGTDFPGYFKNEGGCVLSTAINKYIFVVIKERFDDFLRIGYTQTEIVDNIDDIHHELIREAFRKTGINKGVELITMGDIPAGTGLGSSSTVTVGALHAMYAYRNVAISPECLADEACDIEVNVLKKPIGFQDQYIAAYGGLRFIEFCQDGQIIPEELKLDPETYRKLGENLMLFFTGVTRKAETILSEQKDNINQRLPVLRKLKEMAYQSRDALQAGRVDEIGYLLHESWQLKKQLANGISNSVFEDLYDSAIHAGAFGGKITGAGGGGCLLLYCPPGKRENVREALNGLRELPFRMDPEGTKTILNYRY